MSIKNRSNLNSEADSNINDNTNEEISAQDVRDLIKNVIDSSYNKVDDAGLASTSFVESLQHNAVSINSTNGNGLTINNQVLSINLANSGTNGSLSATDFNTFNNKASTSFVENLISNNQIDLKNYSTTAGVSLTSTNNFVVNSFDEIYLNSVNDINLESQEDVYITSAEGTYLNATDNISLNGADIYLNAANTLNFDANQSISLTSYDSTITLTSAYVEIGLGTQIGLNTDNTEMILDQDGLGHNIFQDASTVGNGLKYFADYSATFVNRSLVDKAYVDAKFSSAGGGGTTLSLGSNGNGLYVSSGTNLNLRLATTSTSGALSNIDWNTFNNKASTSFVESLQHNAVTINSTNGNGLTINNQVLAINLANTGTSGSLSSTDYNTFNNKASTSFVETNFIRRDSVKFSTSSYSTNIQIDLGFQPFFNKTIEATSGFTLNLTNGTDGASGQIHVIKNDSSGDLTINFNTTSGITYRDSQDVITFITLPNSGIYGDEFFIPIEFKQSTAGLLAYIITRDFEITQNSGFSPYLVMSQGATTNLYNQTIKQGGQDFGAQMTIATTAGNDIYLYRAGVAATNERVKILSTGVTLKSGGSSTVVGTKFVNNADASLIEIVDNGNVSIGGAGSFAGLVKSLFITDITTAASTSPSGGALIYSSSGNMSILNTNGLSYPIGGAFFTNIAQTSLSNTASEIDILPSSSGTSGYKGIKTLLPNTLTNGKSLRITLCGYITNFLTPTLQIKLKLGSTVINDSGANSLVVITGNGFFEIYANVTCAREGSNGAVYSQLYFDYQSSVATINRVSSANTVSTVVNLAASNLITLTAQFGTADALNKIVITNAIMEILN